MLGYFRRFDRRINAQVSAGESNHLQMVFLEHVAQRLAASEFLDAVGTCLNSRESHRGDVLNRLPVVSTPSDGGVSDVNFEGRQRNGRVEVRQVRLRIQPLSSRQPAARKSRRASQGTHSGEKLTARFASVHLRSFLRLVCKQDTAISRL